MASTINYLRLLSITPQYAPFTSIALERSLANAGASGSYSTHLFCVRTQTPTRRPHGYTQGYASDCQKQNVLRGLDCSAFR